MTGALVRSSSQVRNRERFRGRTRRRIRRPPRWRRQTKRRRRRRLVRVPCMRPCPASGRAQRAPLIPIIGSADLLVEPLYLVLVNINSVGNRFFRVSEIIALFDQYVMPTMVIRGCSRAGGNPGPAIRNEPRRRTQHNHLIEQAEYRFSDDSSLESLFSMSTRRLQIVLRGARRELCRAVAASPPAPPTWWGGVFKAPHRR